MTCLWSGDRPFDIQEEGFYIKIIHVFRLHDKSKFVLQYVHVKMYADHLLVLFSLDITNILFCFTAHLKFILLLKIKIIFALKKPSPPLLVKWSAPYLIPLFLFIVYNYLSLSLSICVFVII